LASNIFKKKKKKKKKKNQKKNFSNGKKGELIKERKKKKRTLVILDEVLSRGSTKLEDNLQQLGIGSLNGTSDGTRVNQGRRVPRLRRLAIQVVKGNGMDGGRQVLMVHLSIGELDVELGGLIEDELNGGLEGTLGSLTNGKAEGSTMVLQLVECYSYEHRKN
jgi:hypothetical protein